MIFRQFKGEDISLYGMGCMRLPKTDATDDTAIDEAQVFEMVDYALAHGVNYFDTAWGYHKGASELVMGRALARHPRESFKLADKFPGYDPANWDKVAEIFPRQLEKTQAGYFDFYLVHNVCEMNIDAYLDDERYGIHSYLKARREEGAIRSLGFSVHGSYEVMRRFLEAYGTSMEFVQIQLNYLDYEFQDAKAKLELAAEYGLPVIVMEPLRGGMLAKATEEEARLLRAQRPDEGIVGWAERYLQGFDQVITILNGASSLEQMQENLTYFEAERPLTAEDRAVLDGIVAARLEGGILPCTACRYCTPHCPQEIDIPQMLQLFNEHKFSGGGFLAPMFLGTLPPERQPSACIACGSCATVCPQQIDIPQALEDFVTCLEELPRL